VATLKLAMAQDGTSWAIAAIAQEGIFLLDRLASCGEHIVEDGGGPA